jgi:hypothetical protein
MKISESIRRDVFQVSVGGIINRFKVGKRRNPLFFDDIGLEYVRLCDDMGYEKEMRQISHEWGFILFERVVSPFIRKLPYLITCNILVKKLFKHMGYMDNIHFSRNNDVVNINTKNEHNVKAIGINSLHTGLYMGILSVAFNSQIEFIGAKRIGGESNGDCEYTFRVLEKPLRFESKNKSTYDRLNCLPSARGPTLKDALKSNVFKMDGNMIYFRGRRISSIENTIFHLFGRKGILLEKVPGISYEYFKGIVEKESTKEEKLSLMKFLLQVMGWGIVKIAMNNKRMVFHIGCPPYGLQAGDDNWDFLANVILGYLWLIDKNFEIKETRTDYKKLTIEYSA